MNEYKRDVFIVCVCLLLICGSFVYNVGGQEFSNSYGTLEVYPEYAGSPTGDCVQNWMFRSNYTGIVDLAFRFNTSLNNGYIKKYANNGNLVDIDYNHVVFGGYHYYVISDIGVVSGRNYSGTLMYNTGYDSGKWDLYVKRDVDTWDNYRVHLDPYWNNDFRYNIVFSVNNSYIDNPLTDFPIMVKVTDFTELMDDRKSIRFVDYTNTSELYFSIERFTTNNLIAWVNLTNVNSTSVTKFNMYFNNSAVSNTSYQNADKTWRSEYLFVSHCNESSGNLVDVSGNNNDMVVSGSPSYRQSISKVGYAIYLGNAPYFYHTSFLDSFPSELTCQGWYRPDSFTENRYLYSKTNNNNDDRFHLAVLTNKSGYAMAETNLGGNDLIRQGSLGTSVWSLMYFQIKDNDDIDMTINNTFYDGPAVTVMQDGTDTDFYIGRVSTVNDYHLDGYIDEFRVASKKWNASWLKADYYSMEDKLLTNNSRIRRPCVCIHSNPTPTNISTGVNWATLNLTIDVNGTRCSIDYVNISLDNGTFLYYNNYSLGGYSNGTFYYDTTFNLSSITGYNWYVNTSCNGTKNSSWYNFTTFGIDNDAIYNLLIYVNNSMLKESSNVNIVFSIASSFILVLLWIICMYLVLKSNDKIVVGVGGMFNLLFILYFNNTGVFPSYAIGVVFGAVITFIAVYRMFKTNKVKIRRGRNKRFGY